MVAKRKNAADTYTFDGDVHSAPDWVDRNWAGFDRGPALHVPNDNGPGGPYTTKPCRVGDTITRIPGANGARDTFSVTEATDPGSNAPGVNIGDPTGPTFRPAQETTADLGDLVKTGAVNPDDMDPEARAQYDLRQGTSSAAQEAKDAAKGGEAQRGTKARK